MLEFKQGQNARLPVRLLDASGNPITGTAFGSVTGTLMYADGTFFTLTLDGSHWVEAVTDAFSGSGTYSMIVPAAQVNQVGILVYAAKVSGAQTFENYVKVVANEEVDTYQVALRAAGLLHENSVMDQTTYDINNNLLTARIRLYDTKAHALAAGVTGLLHTYAILATYNGAKKVATYTMTLES